MLFKRIILFITIIIMTFTLMYNYKNNAYASQVSNSNSEKLVNVAFLLFNADDLYMLHLKKGFENIEKENPTKVHFTFYDGKNSIGVQNETLDLLSKDESEVDLIIVYLADVSENAVNMALDITKPKNIPMIFLGIPSEVVSNISRDCKRVAFLSANSAKAGTAEGNIVVNLWNTNKKDLDKNGDNILQYVILQGRMDSPTAISRTKYFISALNNAGIKIEQLASANDNWLKDLAKDSMDSIFLNYDDKIEAVISNTDVMAIGAIEALQKYGYNKGDKSKNIAVVGIDGLPEAKELIDNGFMTGTVSQDPNVLVKALYDIGTNLIKGLNPIENTNYSLMNKLIEVPYSYDAYIKK
ncbi:putative galactoside ABC transporter, periplasmic D-galactose/D-glucose-binding protein [Clostridium sp. DL-VIII]|uniref:galactose ABC transporter substrate-binding protein n=1 Tax=Clostridium sp. DL-VIII TaxID=641107 RepID=UPI00023AF6FE|nr:putative galactoside ABC transporter, periplasmic D-galactose/D-glucose-binding protein [Clostridium sp. DL-VIII]